MKKNRKVKQLLRSTVGMTLVEMLVALTLLALIALTFIPAFSSYFKNIRTAGDRAVDAYRRASRMERVISGSTTDYTYEQSVSSVPITFTTDSAHPTTVSFSGRNEIEVNGSVLTDNYLAPDENTYSTFTARITGNQMACFPSVISDDFSTKTIYVVIVGREFNNGKNGERHGKIDRWTLSVDKDGTDTILDSKYYDFTPLCDQDIIMDANGEYTIARITLYGANDMVCFENSPLTIKCNDDVLKVDITAPEIIMVGEGTVDGTASGDPGSTSNRYYYATAGVQYLNGSSEPSLEIIAKPMNNAPLKSAMNDVEWVQPGMGDNGNGAKNKYGYYVMGGDAGQVRRFWQKKDYDSTSTSKNYMWGGDILGQYDRYYYITGNNSAAAGSKEDIIQTKTTQAQFKSIFRSSQNEYDYNGVKKANQLTSDELITLGFVYKMISANYYTANVTSNNLTTLGRVLSYQKGSDKSIIAGNTTESPKLAKTWNSFLYMSLLPNSSTYTSKLNLEGYKTATNYEYPDDNSLITITSVGAIQINTSNPKYHQSTQTSVLGKQLYPTQSYTLYCGKIPAVIDTWGWKTANNVVFWLNQNWSMWLHTGTLGVALSSDGSYWYPTGKFGDSRTPAKTGTTPGMLSSTVFGTNTNWSNLLNFGGDATKYPYGNTDVTVSVDEYVATGKYTGKHKVEVYFKWTGPFQWSQKESSEVPTEIGKTYNSEREKICTGGGTTMHEIRKFVVDDKYTTVVNDTNFYDGKTYDIKIGPDEYAQIIYVSDGRRLSFPNQIREAEMAMQTTTDTGKYRYYGPIAGSGAGFVTSPSDVSGLNKRSFAGTALPAQGNDYYVSAGHEVDVTIGYLSQPYAIDVNNPTVPRMSGLSGLTGGSDFYFKKPGDGIGSSILSGGAFNHSFVSGGLRDNVTMLDVKSFHDDITDNNISLAVGYSLSYVANDYAYCTRLGQVLNNGLVYIRATGDGTVDSENEKAGDLSSGKGWSLAKETNVFHQFFGIDQYRGVSVGDGVGTSAILGWNTTYHKGYLNMSTDSERAPQSGYSPQITTGDNNYGINFHPLMDTECTAVNWGNTWDGNRQAMWGTANGTLMSWAYITEASGTNFLGFTLRASSASKVSEVVKEFENYSWCDNLGINLKSTSDSNKKQYFDYNSVKNNESSNYGFVSVLKSVNDVCYGDDLWVAVGDWSGKNPANYCASGQCYTAAGTGTYINVRYTDDNGKCRWKAVRVSDDHCDITSVAFCNGWWYISGNELNNDGTIKEGVFFFAKDPLQDFSQGNTTNPCWKEVKNVSVYGSDGKITKNVSLSKINSMASQEG